uniref:Transcriptional regulator n=1 Tax=Heterorhabditis bacteriophora TaxID=37862 RepID=A0A1I7WHU1_HETBA
MVSIDFLPSNPNSLLEMLQLSAESYQAGNENGFNKIHRILDELLKMKEIKKHELKTIYKNIGI